MKKFLVFLVAIIVVVSFGLTTYYFLRNDEVIRIETKEIFCNAGDSIALSDLKISRFKKSDSTKFNYNAGSEEVVENIFYDAKTKCYNVSDDFGGDVKVVISTTNKRYKKFEILFHVGNGSANNPYYIFNEMDLKKIGSTYLTESKHFRLQNDILLSKDFEPIASKINEGFNGTFDGNGKTVKGLNLTTGENAGLFAKVGKAGYVHDLTIENSVIAGEIKFAGALAGVVDGKVKNVQIKNPSITSSKDGAMIGGLAGIVTGEIETSYVDGGKVVSAVKENQSILMGGLVGCLDAGKIRASYVNETILKENKNVNIVAGGLVGNYKAITETKDGSIQQSYANAVLDVEREDKEYAGTYHVGSFVGRIEAYAGFPYEEKKMQSYLVGNVAVGENVVGVNNVWINSSENKHFFLQSEDDNSVIYFDETDHWYFIKAVTEESLKSSPMFNYFYDISENYWDEGLWLFKSGSVPTLRLNNLSVSPVTAGYLNRGKAEVHVPVEPETLTFKEIIENNDSITLDGDVVLDETWTPISISNKIINGNGYSITLKGGTNLFNEINNSSIANLKIIVEDINFGENAVVGILANTIKGSVEISSSLQAVEIIATGAKFTGNVKLFGGLVGSSEYTSIFNCKVQNLVVSEFTANEVAGLVAKAGFGTYISNADVQFKAENIVKLDDGNLSQIGGIVSSNEGTIINSKVAFELVNNNVVPSDRFIGAVSARNNSIILNVNADVKVSIGAISSPEKVQTMFVGGVAGYNDKAGEIENVKLTGEGITVVNTEEVANSLAGNGYFAGLVADNNGKIVSSVNEMKTVGACINGKQINVAGIVCLNNSENAQVTKCVTSSDLYGNEVAGIVLEMNNSEAIIDQVVVAKIVNNKVSEKVKIVGSKYVASVAVAIKGGTVTNVQTECVLSATQNDTYLSMAVLVFPDGAVFSNSVLNNGVSEDSIVDANYYVDTWRDYNAMSSEIKNEFGLTETITGDSSFCIYDVDAVSGEFTSVVINIDTVPQNAKRSTLADSEKEWWGGYDCTYNEINFYRVTTTEKMKDLETFKSEWRASATHGVATGFGKWLGLWGSKTFTHEMTFAEDVWSVDENATTAISLAFLSELSK
ncbi:MAG: hypothetical protein E7374_02405 [Clostridiales bacterium]|nr:hypothetical protein [Clostridiales bacterium]